MPLDATFHGTKFTLPDFDGLQDPADYVKTQLGIIVVRLRFDTIYDSMTGYAVGTLLLGEIRSMLDQIWHSELQPELSGILAVKAFPSATDFVDVIDSGVNQLRIRMLATMRPTPALAFSRDMLSLERLRKADPNRISSYLLIRLLTDNHFQRTLSNGLVDVLARHESAIQIGRIVRDAKNSFALERMTRQLIELDARYDITRVRFALPRQQILGGFYSMLIAADTSNDSVFDAIAAFASKTIGDCEKAEILEAGNRLLRPAFIEKTHAEVMAGIHARSKEMTDKENQVKMARAKAAAPKNPLKQKIKINLTGLDFDALFGVVKAVE